MGRGMGRALSVGWFSSLFFSRIRGASAFNRKNRWEGRAIDGAGGVRRNDVSTALLEVAIMLSVLKMSSFLILRFNSTLMTFIG